MKKISIILLLCCIFLASCKEDHTEKLVENTTSMTEPSKSDYAIDNQPSTPPKELPNLQLDRSSFHSVIGWLNDEEILFILVENGKWTVQAYSVEYKSWRLVYETSLPIIQGEIHPSKEMIMLHISENSSSAEIQLIDINGVLLQSLHFESAEMYMSWHPTNPELIAFSAFYEDWSYSSFVYDGKAQELLAIDVNNPFIKWYDDEHLMVFEWNESSLDGSKLSLYSFEQKVLKETKWDNILDVIFLGDTYLYIQIEEESDVFRYQLVNKKTEVKQEWTSPAVSNYSEWVTPNISVLYPDKVMISEPIQGGNLDTIEQENLLTRYSLEGTQEFGVVNNLPIDCSPNGQVCLSGYEKEKWIQVEPFKGEEWLEIKE